MLLDADFEFINEAFEADAVTPPQLDLLLANGWRHFGSYFFRYNLGFFQADLRLVMPLRITLSDFGFSKSQRRLFRQNADLAVDIGPVKIDAAIEDLFHLHKLRFDHNIPDSIFDFVPPDGSPCDTRQLTVSKNDAVIAASWFDVGDACASGVYAIFDPAESHRGLGIFTMLKEIEFAVADGKTFYYQGYAYEGESFYDYKKRFKATTVFDWKNEWTPMRSAD